MDELRYVVMEISIQVRQKSGIFFSYLCLESCSMAGTHGKSNKNNRG